MFRCIFLLVFCLYTYDAKAQMNETLGVLEIDGALSSGAYGNVMQMNGAMNNVRLQQDMAELVTEVQTRFMSGYNGLDKSLVNFDGLRNYDWDIGSDNGNEFYVQLKNIDSATCFLCQHNMGAKQVTINNGQNDCTQKINEIKLYF